ncbi:MAG: copper resistance protein CopC [Methylocystis sp.]|nr:copper resistance protein CopC [Methylocystis sp.]MBI5313863.1 copper resistance protein CopC [Methylocystis sp.]
MTNDAMTNADRTSLARARRQAGFSFSTAAGACAIVIAAAFGTNSALAHSFLVDATPSSKEHVAAPPKTIKLRFGGGVEPPYSKITVETPDGKVLAQGNSAVPDKPRELSANAPELAPGKYIVRYRVLSTDGHIVEGNYEFTVDAK